MAEEALKPRLGRGLAALIGDVGDDLDLADKPRGQRRVAVEFLRPNPRNPRKRFADRELDELAASIRQRGIVQPIVVRDLPDVPGAYEIVAGERRWRAAQRAGLHEVPVVVVEVDDRTSLEYAIIENVQRADLNAIEEAAGYERLMAEFRYSQADLAQILGRSRSHVANTLRLLQLPASIQTMVTEAAISAGHARALLAVKDPEATAKRIVDEGLNVREVERIAHEDHGTTEPRQTRPRRADKDPDTRAVEQALEDVLGLKVAIDHKGQGGELRIRYGTLDQLDALCRRLKGSAPA
jgi:ParB family chromosome partitioning protein